VNEADRSDLRDLVEGYAMTADRRDTPGFAALFTPDAILVIHGAHGGEQGRYVGRDEIAGIPERLARYDATMHHVTNHRVQLEADSGGDRATGESYCIAHHLQDDSAVDHVLHIRYEDRYLRSDEGWRFVHRDVRVQWIDDRRIGSIDATTTPRT
jgi:hypothetical protein